MTGDPVPTIPDLLSRRNAVLDAADGLPDAYRVDIVAPAHGSSISLSLPRLPPIAAAWK